jgi:hypothetical protein
VNREAGSSPETDNEQKESDIASSPSSSPLLPPISNRMTEVIQRIERLYDKGIDFGYDRDDSFIDNSDIVSSLFFVLSLFTRSRPIF